MRSPWLQWALLLQLWLQNLTPGTCSLDLSQLDSEKPVQHVTLLVRHGARTPSNVTYPNDPLNVSEIWPEGFYQLTNNGKRQTYELGIWLRKRYDNLLGDYYVPEELLAESTDSDRTIMSALLILAGLFPPKGHQIWNPDLLWQPIPVVTLNESARGVMSSDAHIMECDRYKEEYKLMLESVEYIQLRDKYKDVVQYVRNNTGLTSQANEFADLMATLDYIHSQIQKDLAIPEWAQEIYPEQWSSAASNYFYIATFNDKLKRLFAGGQLKEIKDQMEATKTGQSRKKITLQLGHADTLAGLLNTLKIFNGLEPPTSSMMALELRKDLLMDSYFVSIYFKNTSTEAYWLELPGCEIVCPLEKFFSISSPYTQTRSWAEECQLQSSATTLGGAGSLITLIIIAVKVACIM